jgi:broad specificity phosphatase PhoE
LRILEVRRHAHTEKGARRGVGSDLSQVGISAARRVGDTVGPFAYLLASDIPRSLETALAMGFAVDECASMDGMQFEAARQELANHGWWQMAQPFTVWGEHVTRGGAVTELALHQESLWRAAMQRVPDGASALVISHGGLIEPGLVVCLPDARHDEWGAPFSNLEGARLCFEDDDWVAIELLRTAQD